MTEFTLDPYNPLKSLDDIKLYDFPIKNMSIEERIKRTQAMAYWAENWYDKISNFTPKSMLIKLDDNDVNRLMNSQLSDKLKEELQAAMNANYHFIKSTSKSSHSRKYMTNLDECLDELTN